MASTYSPSLRLELMATGDQSGTWGDTTNTNLGTLLEQAITGFLSVAQGDVANLTLTALDGASDQSRNMIVELTGAMTAGRNVVVPTAEKLYLIKNSTSGGFAVTVKTAAGTGPTVPPGTARWVYCDGTNVIDGQSGPWSPSSNDAQALGFSGTAWADLFLASGGVVNWNAGDVTITHSANTLAFAGASSGYTFDAVISGTTASFTGLTLTSTDAGAGAAPILELYRNSATPAANDILGQVLFNGEDSAGNTQEYASIEALVVDPTSTAEDGAIDIYTTIAGSRTKTMSIGPNNPNTTTQFIDGYATTATAAGTTTLTVLSAKNQYFTGSTTQTVVLPVTSTLVLGQQFRIINNSTGKVTVQSSGANTIQVMGGTVITFAPGAPGTELVLTCIATTGTGTASWAFEYVVPTTPWVAYTPTFTNFGTATSISMFSRRVGDTLEIQGVFTTGTPGAGEARVSLGFNGTDSNVTSDTTKVASLRLAGLVIQGAATASSFYALIESGVGYLTFGIQNGSFSATAKANGSGVFSSSSLVSIKASVPITGA